MKNRTLLGILCIILAVAVSFGVAPLVSRAGARQVDVVCVAADVPQGRPITEADVKVVTVGGHGLSDKVIRDKAQAVGKYAACDLKADGLLLNTQVSERGDGTEDVLRSLDGSRQAVSITIGSFAGGLSGKLRNGDIVSVLVTGEDHQTVIPAELKYVRVITATSSQGTDAGQTNEDGQEELPSTVTLLVNETQARLLANKETNGKVHLALVFRGEDAKARQFLDAQDKVFKGGV